MELDRYKPLKGIVVIQSEEASGVICKCGNVDEKAFTKFEATSKAKDAKGVWTTKTKDYIKCTVCGALSPYDEFRKALEELIIFRSKPDKSKDKPGILSEMKLPNITHEKVWVYSNTSDNSKRIKKTETKEVVDCKLDEVSTMKDGSMEVGVSDVKYKGGLLKSKEKVIIGKKYPNGIPKEEKEVIFGKKKLKKPKKTYKRKK